MTTLGVTLLVSSTTTTDVEDFQTTADYEVTSQVPPTTNEITSRDETTQFVTVESTVTSFARVGFKFPLTEFLVAVFSVTLSLVICTVIIMCLRRRHRKTKDRERQMMERLRFSVVRQPGQPFIAQQESPQADPLLPAVFAHCEPGSPSYTVPSLPTAAQPDTPLAYAYTYLDHARGGPKTISTSQPPSTPPPPPPPSSPSPSPPVTVQLRRHTASSASARSQSITIRHSPSVRPSLAATSSQQSASPRLKFGRQGDSVKSDAQGDKAQSRRRRDTAIELKRIFSSLDADGRGHVRVGNVVPKRQNEAEEAQKENSHVPHYIEILPDDD